MMTLEEMRAKRVLLFSPSSRKDADEAAQELAQQETELKATAEKQKRQAAELKARQEGDRARQAAEQKVRQEAELKAQQDAERAPQEAELKARQQAELKKRKDGELKAQQDAERAPQVSGWSTLSLNQRCFLRLQTRFATSHLKTHHCTAIIYVNTDCSINSFPLSGTNGPVEET
jgi:hypothetical protein